MKAVDIQGDPGRKGATLILVRLITQTLIGTTNTAIILGENDLHGVCKLPSPQCIFGDHPGCNGIKGTWPLSEDHQDPLESGILVTASGPSSVM